MGNMVVNACGISIGLGLAMALDTLCAQAFGAKQANLVGLHCQRGMAILTLACAPILVLLSFTRQILSVAGVHHVRAHITRKLVAFMIQNI